MTVSPGYSRVSKPGTPAEAPGLVGSADAADPGSAELDEPDAQPVAAHASRSRQIGKRRCDTARAPDPGAPFSWAPRVQRPCRSAHPGCFGAPRPESRAR